MPDTFETNPLEMTEVELAQIELSYSSVTVSDAALFHAWQKHVKPLVDGYRRERKARLALEEVLKTAWEELGEAYSTLENWFDSQ